MNIQAAFFCISYEELIDDGSDEPLDAIGWMRERTTYENLIKDNIDYDIMIEKFEKNELQKALELIDKQKALIKAIYVYDDKRLEIKWNFNDTNGSFSQMQMTL